MLNRFAPSIVRQNDRDGRAGELLGMRPSAILRAAWVIAALACVPAAAQEADITDEATPPADTPLTPEESAALGHALLFDPTNFAVSKPAKPLRLPGLNDPNKFDVSHSGKPDGSSTLVLKQPLASEWDAKVGADLKLAAPATDG